MYFSYRARDASGRLVKGVIEAEHRNLAIDKLLREKLIVLEIKEDRDREIGERKSIEINLFQKVKLRDISLFTRQLGTMVASGLPIIRCFEILAAQTANQKLKKIAQQVKLDLEGGLSLHEAMGKHRPVFSNMYISMIQAGETGGMLDNVLMRMSEHLEREWEINNKVRSASTYPVMVLVVALAVVGFILTYVMPTFVDTFAAAGAELPAFTLFFLGVSDFLQKYILLLLAGLALLVFGLKTWGKQPAGRLFFDRLYLKMPIIGKTVNRVAVSRFTRTMAALTSSGVPILQSLEVLKGVIGNAYLGNAIAEAQSSIKEGESIAEPLARTEVFEPMVTQMIAVGEETGALDEMLQRMSDFYDREVIYAVESMMSMLEPVLIIFVAGMIGMIIIATYLPVFSIVGTM